MKIICETQDEYDQLMKTSKYLHDFNIKGHCLNQEIGLVGFLCNIYLPPEDWGRNKDEVIIKQF